MENRTHAIVVGLFALLLGATLLFSFWWLNGAQQTLNFYTVIAKQPVTGLVAESVVKYRGVAMGKVVSITLDPHSKTTIFIKIRMPESLPLTQETFAELRPQGVTGLAYIDINDPSASAPLLKDGDTIPLRPSMLDALMARGPVLLDEIEQLLKSSNDAIRTANQAVAQLDIQKLNQTLANVERASHQLEPLLKTSKESVERIGTMASEKNQQQLRQTLASVQKTAEQFQPLLIDLNATSTEYRALASELKQGSHVLTETVAMDTLPEIHQLTVGLHHDVSELGHFIQSLEDNPQSLIFGAPLERPGPGEAGFSSKP